MSNDTTNSIHDFDLDLIVEYYATTKRQGPGSPEITKKALSFIDNLTSNAHVADLGCGTGGQTIVLGQNTECQITGVDLFPTFIKLFNANTLNHGLQNKVKGIVGSMDDLKFDEEELDLIWSEGAIYNIGFEKGLNYWKQFLKKGGYVAVTEAAWFTHERPAEIEDFWMDAYPGIDTVPNKVVQMQNAGYKIASVFNIPENCWIDHFYTPQHKLQADFLKRHSDSDTAKGFIANLQHEEQLYHKYKKYYGYTFFIGRKTLI